jgi:hypothetical protein
MNQIDRAIEAGTKACELAEKNARDRSNERAKCDCLHCRFSLECMGEDCGRCMKDECECDCHKSEYDLKPGTLAWQSAVDATRHSSQREE